MAKEWLLLRKRQWDEKMAQKELRTALDFKAKETSQDMLEHLIGTLTSDVKEYNDLFSQFPCRVGKSGRGVTVTCDCNPSRSFRVEPAARQEFYKVESNGLKKSLPSMIQVVADYESGDIGYHLGNDKSFLSADELSQIMLEAVLEGPEDV